LRADFVWAPAMPAFVEAKEYRDETQKQDHQPDV
jgi:hypothetical protein